MSTNKLSHLKEWEKIYIPLERILHLRDDTDWLCFHDVNWCISWVDDDDTFYTLDDLKQLANDGMPKQGDKVEVRYIGWDDDSWACEPNYFVCLYKNQVVVERKDWNILRYDQWRYPQKKIQKTLAELEKELGYEEGTLEITN